MRPDQLAYRRRTLVVGAIALACWIMVLLVMSANELDLMSHSRYSDSLVLWMVLAWAFTPVWVGLDAYCRDADYRVWTVAALVSGPVGGILYLILRPWAQPVCMRCGSPLVTPGVCHVCGYEGWMNGAWAFLGRLGSGMMQSMANGSVERTRHTIKFTAIALAVTFAVISFAKLGYRAAYDVPTVLHFLGAVSGAGYWVLIAWWVYLDATWRRMSALPWAVLALVTNIIGLVTYLVIRYPDPRLCSQCGAEIPTGLKRCPYCGTETQPSCPQCQSPVQPGWAYCPACSGKLPEVVSKPASPATITISGNVVDASTGSPIAGAEVRVDSRTSAASAVTDASGRYVLSNLAPRPYVLVASSEGYVMQVKTYEPQPGSVSQVSFSLGPDGVVSV